MANVKINDLAAAGTVTDNMQLETDIAGTTANRVTALQIKDYVGVGQEGYDATVGPVGSGADYNLLQVAIDASKFNLLIIGDYTTSELITLGANFVQITIAKSWTINEEAISIGTGGLKIQNGILIGIYTTLVTKMFIGSGALQLHNVAVDTTSSTIANAGIADLTIGTKHIISDCTFKLSNTAECGFKNPSTSSSFTNLNAIGGGAACSGFILGAEDCIIDNINVSGTIDIANEFITTKIGTTMPPTISNILSPSGSEMLIGLMTSKIQLSNVNGRISLNLTNASSLNMINCDLYNLNYVSGTNDDIHATNVMVRGSTAISIPDDSNIFVNCNFNPAVTLTVASNNNQFLLCKSTGGFTDNGTDNAFIEEISDDVLMTADSARLLATQHSIKTYADNIAKGITVDYYFSDTPDGVIANYDLMYPSDTGEVESTAAAALPAADTLIQTFITQTTEPNFTTLLAGIYDIHIHAAKTAGTKDAFIYAEFYKRTEPGGVETLLATSDNSALLTGSNVGYTLHFTLLDDEILNDTDRLVVKFYGSPAGTGSDPTATLYLEGANASRIDIHTTTSSWMLNLENIIYVNGAGNDSNAGKNMGTPKLTIAAGLTAAALQTPSSTNIIVVKVLGGPIYAEDVIIPSWVVLDMSDAISNGQVTVGVTMGADSFYYFNEAIMPSGKESVRCIGAGIRYIKGNFTTPETNSTFLTASGGATVYLDIVKADAVKTGATFSTLTTAATLFIKAQTFRETVASTSVGSTVFRNIADDGSNADTSSINEAGNQIIRGKDKTTLGTTISPDLLDLNGSYQKWTTNPHFIAYNNAQLPNVTGDGTLYTLPFNQVDANIGGHYNPATGVFTAATTGLYFFNIVLVTVGFNAAHNDFNIRLLTTTANWYLVQLKPLDIISIGGYIILTGSVEVLMNAGNTARFQVQVVGGTKAIDIQIGSTYSGRLLTRV